jgi:hypothetical protein
MLFRNIYRGFLKGLGGLLAVFVKDLPALLVPEVLVSGVGQSSRRLRHHFAQILGWLFFL